MNLVGKKVYVYRNLKHGHSAPKLYSIMYKGKVVSRRKKVLLADVRFLVRPGGYKRVLATHCKNVHAFAVGTLVGSSGCMGIDSSGKDFGVKLVYSPTFGPFFWSWTTGKRVDGAAAVLLNQNGISACYTI